MSIDSTLDKIKRRESPAVESGTSAAEAKVRTPGDGRKSFLERSSARRETAMPGSSVAAKPALRIVPSSKPASASRPEHWSEPAAAADSARSRRRPAKLLDKKAAAIARDLAERQSPSRAARTRRREGLRLALAFVIIAAIGVGLHFALPVVTRVSKVSVTGMRNVTEADILSALELTPEVNLMNADIAGMRDRILLNPKIADASIGRSFPDKLAIALREREPVACILVNAAEGMKPVAIDRDGVAYAYLDSLASKGSLPVLSGIRFEKFVPGQKLPEFLVPLLGDIAELGALQPSPLEAFSEIRVERLSGNQAELLLFPASPAPPVRMPMRLTRETMSSVLLVLDIVASRKGADKVEEIDFRTGTIVYKTKEAQAG